jgi:predicted hotdog family 3-hydroxylacyl-ACP dehydratase
VSHQAIETLIPHRGAMLLLDAVVTSSAEEIVCRAKVREGNLFLRRGRLRSVVCLEYMAQAVAAFAGLQAQQPGPPPVGYLIAATRMTLFSPSLVLGDEIDVAARRVWGDSALGKFTCTVTRGGSAVAEAAVSVYQPPLAAQAQP